METKAQLEKWLKQLKDNPCLEAANPDVARRLVNHGLGACDRIARLQAQLEYHMDKRAVVIKPSAPHPAGVSVADVVDGIVSQVGMATLIGKHLLIAQGVPPHEIESLLRKHGL